MASLGRQLVCIACRNNASIISGALSRGQLITRQSRGLTLSLSRGKRFTESKFIGFKVPPRQPITDLVTHSSIYDGPDPAPAFLDPRVQTILQRLTGCDHEKVFRHRKIRYIKPPTYVFMTDLELKKVTDEATRKAASLLIMPPVLSVKKDATVVLDKDPAIKGHYKSKFVFTDISLGVPDNKRLIVTRETDGTLREANTDERRRMNEIYNPRYGRSIVLPELFSAARLKDVLAQGEYEFVLDKTCMQLEPDEALFQSVIATTYDAIDEQQHYDVLLSTRYYGTMLFYFVWHKRADAIIVDMIDKDRMTAAGEIVTLFMLIHPTSGTATAAAGLEQPLQLVQKYIAEDCADKSGLELMLLRHEELQRNKRQFSDGAIAAHGL
uniref:28S ribosomal protein S22, mitochondrial-like n=1 Tax=Hirondellea gigas TaxID=1518452 RepID=A0A2P2HYE8_9CRUS